MNLLVAIDQNFLLPLATLLYSIMEKHTCNEVDVYLLYNELPSCDIEALARIADVYRNFRLVPIRVAKHQYQDLYATNEFPVEACFRLIAPWILPRHIERILWLDADMLCRGDLGPFYEQDLGESCAAACVDAVTKEYASKRHARLGFDVDYYFNSGLILFDLAKLREFLTPQSYADWFLAYRSVDMDGYPRWPDQDALNAILGKRVILWDKTQYNLFVNPKIDISIRSLMAAKLWHFNGSTKPWNYPLVDSRLFNNIAKFYWYRYARKAKRLSSELNRSYRHCLRRAIALLFQRMLVAVRQHAQSS